MTIGRPAVVVTGSTMTTAQAAALRHVEAVCRARTASQEPTRTDEQLRGWFIRPPTGEVRTAWLKTNPAGEAIASAWLACRPSGVADVHVLVAPDERRHGIGAELWATVLEAAPGQTPRVLFGQTSDPDSLAFAERRGGKPGHRTVRQVLSLDGPAQAADTTPRLLGDLRVVTWEGSAPERLLASYAAARDAVNDAPGDPDDVFSWTPEEVRAIEAMVADRGQSMLVTAAVCDHEVVGFTELRIADRQPVASTEDTAVVPQHRRRGVASMVKSASLEHLRTRRPDVRSVMTSNDETNLAMLTVNRRLGFRPVATYTQVRVDRA